MKRQIIPLIITIEMIYFHWVLLLLELLERIGCQALGVSPELVKCCKPIGYVALRRRNVASQAQPQFGNGFPPIRWYQ
jgi:hypothetical protein